MAYYLRTADNFYRADLPSDGGHAFDSWEDGHLSQAFATRLEADTFKREQPIARMEDGKAIYWDRAIVFSATAAEIETYQSREYQRLPGGRDREMRYARVPWAYDAWYDGGQVKRDDHGTYYRESLSMMHICHMSQETPGQIAYTPSVEYGIAGRKVKTTPARYLEKYARNEDDSPALNRGQIQAYVDTIKAIAEGKLTINRTADEAETIYRNGPRSCMSHSPDSYDYGIHPARVYAEPGDLRIAYFGPIGKPTARAVIWPEKKLYGRLYGDTCLREILERNDYRNGSFEGAKLPAISVHDRPPTYLMPYVDGHDFANLSRDGKFMILSEDEGKFDVQGTDGYTRENSHYCPHCDRQVRRGDWDSDNDCCQSCSQDAWSCHFCGDTHYDDSESVYCSLVEATICQSCADDRIASCSISGCENEFDTRSFSRTERNSREARGVSDICPDCGDGMRYCSNCDDLYDEDRETCPDCNRMQTEDTETGDLLSVPDETASERTEPIDGHILCGRTPARVAETADQGTRGSLFSAIDGSFWQYPIIGDAVCMIWDCRRPIHPSEAAVRANVGGIRYYCRQCYDRGRLRDNGRVSVTPPSPETPCLCGCEYPNRIEAETEIAESEPHTIGTEIANDTNDPIGRLQVSSVGYSLPDCDCDRCEGIRTANGQQTIAERTAGE